MKKRIKPVFNGSEIVTSFIYLCSICTALMYVLCRSHMLLCTVIMTVVCFGIFWIFWKLRLKRLWSLLTFIGFLVLVNVVCTLVSSPYADPSFWEFIYTSSDFFNPAYAGAAILLFSMIIGFSAAYFIAYLPRPCFLLLPAFIPLILAGRTLGGLPLGIIIFLAVGFFVACMGLARPETPSGEVYIDDKKARPERLTAIAVLGIAAAVLLLIIPKPETTRYSQYLDNLMPRMRNRNLFGPSTLTDFRDTALPNRGGSTPGTNVLFYAITSDPVNVSKSSYDLYYGEEGWKWIPDKEFETGHSNWENAQTVLSYSNLITKLKRGVANGKLEDWKSELENIPITGMLNSSMTIRVVDNSDTSVVLHPQGTYKATISGYSENIYRNAKNELFTSGQFGQNATYVLRYYNEEPNAEFVKMLENNNFWYLLYDAMIEEVITDAEYDAFTDVILSAESYHEHTANSGVTPEIQALADEITAGLSNDLEKALAIEKWFGDAGFVYDLDYIPEEYTAEYFLFESRRGICSDFATASVLLLRAAGIPARYTEGYVLSEDTLDSYGRYAVTPAQAHAYAESYIEGCGWFEVDGTRYATMSSSIEDALRLVLVIVLAAAAVLTVLAIIFRRQISEFVFALSLRVKKNNAKIRAVYLRTRKLACRISERDPKTATAAEVRDILTRTLRMEPEAAKITDAANELFYGGGSPDTDAEQLYRDYRAIYKMKRSLKR